MRLGDEGGVYRHEAAPDTDQAPLGLGQEVDLLVAERLAVDGELVVEVDQRPEVEAPFGHRRRRRCHDRPQAEAADQELTGPQDADPGAGQFCGPVEQQVGEQVVVELQGVGDLLVEKGVYRLPGPGAPAQGEEQVALCLLPEPGQHRRRHGEQLGRVHYQAWVGQARDLQHRSGFALPVVTEVDT